MISNGRESRASASAAPSLAANQGKGGLFSNTPPDTIHSYDFPLHELFDGGEDWLALNLFVSWGENSDLLFNQLEAAKVHATDLHSENGFAAVIADTRVLIYPGGMRSAGGGPYFRWVFLHQGIQFRFQRVAKATESNANVRVEVPSRILMHAGGVSDVWSVVSETIEGMGGAILRDVVSRVDFCVDLPNVPVSDFLVPFQEFRYISRSRDDELWGLDDISLNRSNRKYTGFNAGKKIRLRVYDKLAELKRKGDDEKLKLMPSVRWKDEDVETASRVEFQLRREALKSFGVSSLHSWFDLRRSILDYLCSVYFRLTDSVPTSNNHSRVNTLQLWRHVHQSFLYCCEQGSDMVRSDNVEYDCRSLLLQAFGCLIAASAVEETPIMSPGEFDTFLMSVRLWFTGEVGEPELMRRIYAAREKHGLQHLDDPAFLRDDPRFLEGQLSFLED